MALCGALGLAWSPVTPVTPRHFAWQAWHNLTSTFVSRGRRGTILHPPSFRVAGVALMALGGALGLALSPVTHGTPRDFAWQAWHNLTSTFVSRGRRGTTAHPPSFHVAGVALIALGGAIGLAWSPVTPGTPRHFAWQVWHNLTSTFVSRGRRGTHGTRRRAWTGLVARDARDAAGLCVAEVAQPHIHLRFTWQAWHNRTSTIVSRGRRGPHGTRWRAWTGLVARDARDAAGLCMAGVAQSHIHLRPPSFCVAGVAQSHIQAWDNLTSTFVLRGRRGIHGTVSSAWDGLVVSRGRRGTISHTIFHTQLCHTPSFTKLCRIPSFTHNLVTHHLSHTTLSHTTLSHTTLSHTTPLQPQLQLASPVRLDWSFAFKDAVIRTIFPTPFFTQLCHTPSLTHHLSHTHTVFHTQLCHTLSFTQNFHPHHLSPHQPSHTTLSHTIFHHTILHTPLCHTPSFTTPSFTHHFVTHHLSPHHLSHITLSHTIFHHTIFRTQLCDTPSFATPSFTHHFVTHHLSHTTLSHALFHTQLSHTHTPSFTHCFVTHRHHLSSSHTIFHIPLCHTQLF